MRKSRTRRIVLILGLLLSSVAVGDEGVIDTTEKWAWSENARWLNFRPTHGGVTVHDTHLSGYAWSESLGWIKLGADEDTAPGAGGPYFNTSATDWGVNRDGSGGLEGFAWSENAGWINFDPSHGQVTIDTGTGHLDGFAWSETVGWIHFRNSGVPYGVKYNPGTSYCDLLLAGVDPTMIHFRAPFLVATGELADLWIDGDFGLAYCLGYFAENPGTDPLGDPDPGEAFYYLAHGVHTCPSYGDSSLATDPRDDLDAADPCP